MTDNQKIATKTISPIIPVELIQRLRAYTARTGVKQNFIIQKALEEYLDKMENNEQDRTKR